MWILKRGPMGKMCGCPQEKIKDVFYHATVNWDSLWIVEILKVECNNHLYRIIFFKLPSKIIKFFTFTLREISQNVDFLCSVFSRIWTESYTYFPVYGQNRKIYDSVHKRGKCGYDSVHIWENTKQRNPSFGILHAMSDDQKTFFLNLVVPLSIFAFWYEGRTFKIEKVICVYSSY